jgi:hypothetical protein
MITTIATTSIIPVISTILISIIGREGEEHALQREGRQPCGDTGVRARNSKHGILQPGNGGAWHDSYHHQHHPHQHHCARR